MAVPPLRRSSRALSPDVPAGGGGNGGLRLPHHQPVRAEEGHRVRRLHARPRGHTVSTDRRGRHSGAPWLGGTGDVCSDDVVATVVLRGWAGRVMSAVMAGRLRRAKITVGTVIILKTPVDMSCGLGSQDVAFSG